MKVIRSIKCFIYCFSLNWRGNSHYNSVISSSFDPSKIDLVHEPPANSFITVEQQCYKCYLFMNDNSPPTLHKQFNTVHLFRCTWWETIYIHYFSLSNHYIPILYSFPKSSCLKKASEGDSFLFSLQTWFSMQKSLLT